MASTPIKFVDSIWREGEYSNHKWICPPGTEGNAKYYSHGTNETAGLQFVCPGCRAICSIAFIKVGSYTTWEWDGNREQPTATPSIHHTKTLGGCGWHGFLTKGVFKGRIE